MSETPLEKNSGYVGVQYVVVHVRFNETEQILTNDTATRTGCIGSWLQKRLGKATEAPSLS